MRINQFLFLTKIEECHSISKAASALYTSQPSISLAIQELEKELGFPILLRTSKGVRFTAEGELVLAEAKKIMNSVTCISEIKPLSLQNLDTTVTVGCDCNFASLMISDITINLKQLYPSLVINSQLHTTLQTIQLIGELSHALAIIHFNDFDEPKIRSEISKYHLQIHELFLDELCFVAYPQHPLFHCQPLCLEQIFAYPFLMDSDVSNVYVKNFLNQLPAYQKRSAPIIQIEDTGSQRYYLNQSQAIQLISRLSLNSGNKIFHDTLKELPVDDFYCSNHIVCLSRPNTHSTAEQLILEIIKNYPFEQFSQ